MAERCVPRSTTVRGGRDNLQDRRPSSRPSGADRSSFPRSTRDAAALGTLTAHEMLCHLGDACEMVTLERPRAQPVRVRRRPFAKYFWLWLPTRWPRGVPTNPLHDPRVEGTRPGDFDRRRLVSALQRIAAAPRIARARAWLVGTMTTGDWQRWAYRHTDHHLRQFGA